MEKGRRGVLKALLAGGVIALGDHPAPADTPEGWPKLDPDAYRSLAGAVPGFSASAISEHLSLWADLIKTLKELERRKARIDMGDVGRVASSVRSFERAWLAARGGVLLHALYFDTFGKGKGGPGERLMRAMKGAFGSFDRFWVEFMAVALSSRAWAALVWDQAAGRLEIIGLDGPEEWPVGTAPLLVADMEDHAYYLDYPGAPLLYLKAWKKVVDWSKVESRMICAQGGRPWK